MDRARVVFGWAWLVLFAVYQAAGLYESRHEARGPLTETFGDVFWPINWRMFTGYNKTHTQILFLGQDGDLWVELPMERWYPARWESGYRWERPWVYSSGELKRSFLAAACQRSGMSAVRMVKKTWPKTLGSLEQPERDVKYTDLGALTCSGDYPLPRGRIY